MSDDGLTLKQFEEWHDEIKRQPAWRAQADRESDYDAGNQLDSDVIRKQQSIGMPPAIDPLIGPELDELCGLETRLRKNWRVVPNSDVSDDDVAEALNVKLNAAERHSKADKVCSSAFRGQAGVGAAFVCVDRDPDPFHFPYRTTLINRNDCYWDWKGSANPDMHDHRYFVRRRWTDKTQAKLFFPKQAELIEHAATGWTTFDKFGNDGGTSTGLQTGQIAWNMGQAGVGAPTMLQGTTPGTYALLYSAYASEQSRGSSIEEQEWRDAENNRICLFEVWYRVWSSAKVFRSQDGRVVEYDPNSMKHTVALALGMAQVEEAVISKAHVAIFLGPHKLSDRPSPFKHNRFPYVPFWGKREERTNTPYGLIRGWMYHQDTVNSLLGKLRWGISAAMTQRTKGAYLGTDEQFRREAARLDADIVLDPKAVKEGGFVKTERNFQLTDQQMNLLIESRKAIKRTGMGLDDDDEKNNPLPQLETIPNQHFNLFDNFTESRNQVGELLTSMIIEDIGTAETQVTVKGDVIRPDKTIVLNARTGEEYITNDVSRTLVKVVLEDVPSTPSYRTQQLAHFAEVMKSAPEKYQQIMYQHLIPLLDVPNRDQVISEIREVSKQPTPEEIQQQIQSAVDAALLKAQIQDKADRLTVERNLAEAKVRKLNADTVATGVTAAYESAQAGGVLITAPQVAPVADAILKGAGYEIPQPGGVSPGIEAAVGSARPNPVPVSGGTHPNLPVSAAVGAQHGIETPTLGD